MLYKIYPDNPQPKKLEELVEILREGGVIIYPTDTVYGLGCDIQNKKAVQRVAQIKGVDPAKADFACICESVSIISTYAIQVDTPSYKLMKRLLPGPYTFILNASKEVPRHFQSRKKTVGIRVVDNPITTELVRLLGNPILTTSLKHDDEILEYNTDPDLIHDRYEKLVDAVIDGGFGGNVGSTIVDLTNGIDGMEVLREGAGDVEALWG
jgi:tRNA threonylcarbamoyl adenosine modification protein (Sua5/YciO/YrdC/YwlC family)